MQPVYRLSVSLLISLIYNTESLRQSYTHILLVWAALTATRHKHGKICEWANARTTAIIATIVATGCGAAHKYELGTYINEKITLFFNKTTADFAIL